MYQTLIQSLATNLIQAMQRCQTPEANGEDAINFLLNLTRLEGFANTALEKAGALNLVEHARMLRNSDAGANIISGASNSLYPDALLGAAQDVMEGRGNARIWGETVLMVATIAPWLNPEKREECVTAMKRSVHFLVAHRTQFKGAVNVTLERACEPLASPYVDQIVAAAAVPGPFAVRN